MKKLINKPETLVREMCNGFVSAYPYLEFDDKYTFIKKKEIDSAKVTLISGGGSGHEPAHAGYIGKGMLDVAVCGDVFASPSQIQVYKAIKASVSEKGTLLIIKNYSGDNMNFKNAMQMGLEEGLSIDYVIVNDDIAVEDSLYSVGRRGVAGTVFVHKIAGAAAEAGASLSEVKRLAQKTISQTKSLGFAFSSCTVPAKGSPTFVLQDNEMEFGVGIHGEPGIIREQVLSSNELASKMIPSLLKELKPHMSEVAIMVNGFGGTPQQELLVFANSVLLQLAETPVKVSRVFVGNYMTSLDMTGASLTILALDDELKKLLTAPSQTPTLSITGNEKDSNYVCLDKKTKQEMTFSFEFPADYRVITDEKLTLANIHYIVDKIASVAIENEITFCELDSFAGDGDFGMSLAKGFKQLKREWKELLAHTCTIGEFLLECSLVIMEHCGGASGPIWGSAFRGAGLYADKKTELSTAETAALLQRCVQSIQDTGARAFGRGAVVGDKTLIDSLAPCADSWTEHARQGFSMVECFTQGAIAAFEGAESTRNIVARMGRAGTLGDRSLGHCDAGAYGLAIIINEVAKDFSKGSEDYE